MVAILCCPLVVILLIFFGLLTLFVDIDYALCLQSGQLFRLELALLIF